MQSEIAGVSVLGFIPTAYPAGCVIGERWNYEANTMERVTGTVFDVERADALNAVKVHATAQVATKYAMSIVTKWARS